MYRLFVEPFQLGYMQRALWEAALLGVLAGAVSVHVLLRRLAYFGDALTHTIFPGVAVAFAAGGSLLIGSTIAAVLSAVLITFASRIRHVDVDAALAVTLGGFFAVGVIVVSSRPSFTSDLTSLLFGHILTVDRSELVETAVLGAIVLTALALTHRHLVGAAFDRDGMEAMGYRTTLLDLLVNLAVALVVVAAVRSVGTVLVVALIVVPGAAARTMATTIRGMLVASIGVAVACGYVGLAASYEASVHHGIRLASGATVVVALTIAFAVASLVPRLRQAARS